MGVVAVFRPLALRQGLLRERLDIILHRLAQLFAELVDLVLRGAVAQRLGQTVTCGGQGLARIGAIAVLGVKRHLPQHVGGLNRGGAIGGHGERCPRGAQTRIDAGVWEARFIRQQRNRVEHLGGPLDRPRRARQRRRAGLVEQPAIIDCPVKPQRQSQRRRRIGAALMQDGFADLDRRHRHRLGKPLLRQAQPLWRAQALLAERIGGDQARFHLHAGIGVIFQQ